MTHPGRRFAIDQADDPHEWLAALLDGRPGYHLIPPGRLPDCPCVDCAGGWTDDNPWGEDGGEDGAELEGATWDVS